MKHPSEQDTIGKRLRWAIERRTSIRKFQQTMERGGLRGSTGTAINRYLQDGTEPSIEWLRAAAEELDVSLVWLALGDTARQHDAKSADAIAAAIQGLEGVLATLRLTLEKAKGRAK